MKHHSTTRRWVEDEIEKRRAAQLVMSLCFLALSGLLFVVVVGCIEMGAWVAVSPWVELNPWYVHAAVVLVIGTMVWSHFRYGEFEATDIATLRTAYRSGEGAQPDTFGGALLVWMLVPTRLLRLSRLALVEYLALSRIPRDQMAAVVDYLMTRDSRSTYDEISAAVDGLSSPRVLPLLATCDGVIPLTSEPAGLKLNDDLRARLGAPSRAVASPQVSAPTQAALAA